MRKILEFLFFILLIYLGTICYVIASFYHLSLRENWYFWKALMIAMPIVLLEYLFSLNGNHYLHYVFDYSPIDILVITICFCFINLWILNYYVLKHKSHNIYMEVLCFGLVLSAFILTTVIR